MSLDVTLTKVMPTEVFGANITHNLRTMAEAANIYEFLWYPEKLGITEAKDLIYPLRKALNWMRQEPDFFRKLDAPNGWGTYDNFVPWIEAYLQACTENPDAKVSVSR